MVYLPGGKSRFSRLFDSANSLLFSIILFIIIYLIQININSLWTCSLQINIKSSHCDGHALQRTQRMSDGQLKRVFRFFFHLKVPIVRIAWIGQNKILDGI